MPKSTQELIKPGWVSQVVRTSSQYTKAMGSIPWSEEDIQEAAN